MTAATNEIDVRSVKSIVLKVFGVNVRFFVVFRVAQCR
jgi:hypothetical protein